MENNNYWGQIYNINLTHGPFRESYFIKVYNKICK